MGGSGVGEPQGPYQPSWRNRRMVVRLTLIYCGAMLPAIIFYGPDTRTAETGVWGLCGVAVFLLAYYLIGPSYELIGLARAEKGSDR